MTRDKIGAHIVEVEGRFDRQGRLLVYALPAADGGGRFEVAGINEKYHRAKATELRSLIQKGQHAKAKQEAGRYIMEFTDPVLDWFPAGTAKKYPHVEMLLRDTFFNRGNRGAAAMLQLALGLPVDGRIGPVSRQAFAQALEDDANALAKRITQARATYEQRRFPWKSRARDERSQFWKGLNNRWNKTHKAAMALVT